MKLDTFAGTIGGEKAANRPERQNYDAFIAVRISFDFQQHDDIMSVVLRLTSRPGQSPAHAAFKRAEYDVALWHSVHRKRGFPRAGKHASTQCKIISLLAAWDGFIAGFSAQLPPPSSQEPKTNLVAYWGLLFGDTSPPGSPSVCRTIATLLDRFLDARLLASEC